MQSNPQPSAAKIHYDLTPEKVELVLIALYVLQQSIEVNSEQTCFLIDAAQKFNSIKVVPPDIIERTHHLCDDLFEPLCEHRFNTANVELGAVFDELDDDSREVILDFEKAYGLSAFGEPS